MGEDKHSISTVKTAFDACFDVKVVNAFYGVVVFFVIVFFVYRLFSLYFKSKDDKKVFFDMLKVYGYCVGFVVCFPFILHYVELILALLETEVLGYFERKTGVQASLWDNVATFAKGDLQRHFSLKRIFKGNILLAPGNLVESALDYVTKTATNTILIQLTKKTFLFFVAARYMWLAMLKIISPFAVVMFVNTETKSFAITWGKNMLLCYMLIPFFLFAEMFSDAIMLAFTNSISLSDLNMFYLIGLFMIKCSLFTVVTKRVMNLM